MKNLSIKIYFILMFCFLGINYARAGNPQDSILKLAINNMKAIRVTPEIAYEKAIGLQNLAKNAHQKEAELLSIVNQCIYHTYNIDFISLKVTAESLFEKATVYIMPEYQAIAKYYLFQAYLFSSLLVKAKKQLDDGMNYIYLAKKNGRIVRQTMINFYIGYANYYLQKQDQASQLKYLRLVSNEILKVPKTNNNIKLQVRHYSNLAQFFMNSEQMDSAKFYATLSSQKAEGLNMTTAEIMNYMILGKVAMKKSDYKKAIFLLQKGINVEGANNHLNLLDLYNYIIECYNCLNKADSVLYYNSMRTTLLLKVSESQNTVLNRLLHKTNSNTSRTILYLILLLGGIIIISIFLVLLNNLRLRNNESQPVSDSKQFKIAEKHLRIIDLIKSNSPAFMITFKSVYPEFENKLLTINPDLSPTEVEFCAYIKMQVPSKDIAHYTYRAPKTIQNKRSIIRRKLHINKEKNLYKWFEDF